MAFVRLTGLPIGLIVVLAIWIIAYPVSSSANDNLQDVLRVLNQPERLSLIVEKRRREIRAYYETENASLLWLGTGRAPVFLDLLKNAYLHGLRPEDYPHAHLETELKSVESDPSLSRRAWVELLFTGHFLDFASDLRAGRVTPRVLYPGAYMPVHTINGTDALTRLSAAPELAYFVSDWEPQDDTYRLLKKHLERLYAVKDGSGFTYLDIKESLSPGGRNDQVPALRRRLFEDGLLGEDTGGDLFDKRLAFAVAQSKHRYVLPVSSEVTPRLVRALNIPIDRRIEQVSNAMERIRWIPPEYTRVKLLINKGESQFVFSEFGRVVMEGQAFANCPDRNHANTATAIEAVTFHPTWQVPLEFLGKELLPRLKNDPTQVENAGYYMRRRGADVPLSSLPWRQATPRAIERFKGDFNLYLPASDENPLGSYAFRLRQEQKLALFHLDSAPEDGVFCNPYLPANAFGIVDGLELLEQVIEPRVFPVEGIQNRLARGDTITFPARSGLMAVATHQSVWLQHQGAIRFGHDPYLEDARLTAALSGLPKP